MALPEFYHIGLPKTGTTSLQYLLRNDDRIDLFYKKRIFQNSLWYKVDPSKMLIVQENKIGVFSDETFLRQMGKNFKHTISLDRLHREKPNAKIIVTIREQKSLLESRYKYGVKQGNISLNFQDWLSSAEGIDFLSLCDYSNIYRILTNYFDKHNIRFFLYEDLKCDYIKYYNKIFNFIGISLPKNISNEKKNTNNLTYKSLKTKLLLNSLIANDFIYNKSKIHYVANKFLFKASKALSLPVSDLTFNWDECTYLKSVEEKIKFSNNRFIFYTDIDLENKGYLV